MFVASAVVFGISAGGYFTRFNILNTTSKKTSTNLAEACAHTALLKLAESSNYAGNETISMNSSTCQIFAIELQPNQKIIKTKGIFQNTTTNLKITIQPSPSIHIISWEEIPIL